MHRATVSAVEEVIEQVTLTQTRENYTTEVRKTSDTYKQLYTSPPVSQPAPPSFFH